MSLRLDFESALTSYLTTVSPSKPSGLNIQAGHRIDDLQVPALVIHAESAEPAEGGIQSTTRKITVEATVITPIQEGGTAVSHSSFFKWTESSLRNKDSMISSITAGMSLLGSYITSEKSAMNDQAMSDTVTAVFWVNPS